MHLPVIANTFRVAIGWVDGTTGQIATNVIHIEDPGGNAPAVATMVDNAINHNMLAAVSDHAHINEYTVTPLDGVSGTIVQTPSGINTGGGGSTSSPASSAVVTVRTAKRGRSFRGRVFLPFIDEAQIADGLLTGGVELTTATGFATFLASISGAGGTWVIASYKLATATPVTSVAVLRALGTQRRRQTRVRYP